LEQYIEKHGKINENKALQWIIEILKGLSKMHSKGMMHRDIKPA
jgi:serine/threonine protein kinase